jgi:hypothetical protein
MMMMMMMIIIIIIIIFSQFRLQIMALLSILSYPASCYILSIPGTSSHNPVLRHP